MSRIDDLIRQHCPNGVQFRPLGEVSSYADGRISADELDQDTFVGVDNLLPDKRGVATATYRPNTTTLTAFAPDDLLIGNIRPYLRKIWLADRHGGCSGDVLAIRRLSHFERVLLPRFLYYVLSSERFFAYNTRFAKGAKMPRGSRDAILRYPIPVPPMEVQREIVRVLDLFQSLEAELEAELEARRQQYAHYRDTLLDFTNVGRETVKWVTLNDVAEFQRGTAITQAETRLGSIPVVANGPDAVYLHDESNRTGETVVVSRSGAHAGSIGYWSSPIFLTDAFSIDPEPSVLRPRFLYYLLVSQQKRIRSLKKGAGVPHVRVKDVGLVIVPVPSLDEQERIVEILDRFDALVNDLSVGLPAELAARRKQYEYYRDRLLTFPAAA